jgi:hypothetical protein
LFVLARHLPPEGALGRAQSDDESAWGIAEHLLAAAVDLLAAGNWQRGGGKGLRPKRVPRPGVDVGTDVETIGGVHTYTPAEMRELLDRHSRGRR